jgi:hypothetical protein
MSKKTPIAMNMQDMARKEKNTPTMGAMEQRT